MASASQTQQPLLRYKLIIAYDGTRYNGFQRQSSVGDNTPTIFPKRRRLNSKGESEKVPITIQQCMEDALIQYSNLSRVALEFRFAGRTDAGVHARGQVVAINLPQSEDSVDSWNIRKSINSRLPSDISVQSVTQCVDVTFDPRKDVKYKQYSYTLRYRRKVMKDGTLLPICTSGPNTIRLALDGPIIWICPWPLDDTKLDDFCQRLRGTHDFSAFVNKRCRRDQDNRLTLNSMVCERLNETNEPASVVTVRFVVEAKGFRRSMVRNLVGLLVDICRGALQETFLDEVWAGTDTIANLVHAAPASGLCLELVSY